MVILNDRQREEVLNQLLALSKQLSIVTSKQVAEDYQERCEALVELEKLEQRLNALLVESNSRDQRRDDDDDYVNNGRGLEEDEIQAIVELLSSDSDSATLITTQRDDSLKDVQSRVNQMTATMRQDMNTTSLPKTARLEDDGDEDPTFCAFLRAICGCSRRRSDKLNDDEDPTFCAFVRTITGCQCCGCPCCGCMWC